MASPTPNPAKSPTKGKSVGIWLSGEALDALAAMGEENQYFRDGTYCAEAVVQRLEREGRMKNGTVGEVAAQAYELAQALGAEVVKAKLLELSTEHAVQMPVRA